MCAEEAGANRGVVRNRWLLALPVPPEVWKCRGVGVSCCEAAGALLERRNLRGSGVWESSNVSMAGELEDWVVSTEGGGAPGVMADFW